MSWALLAIQLALGALFLLAATGKALRSEEFNRALRFSRVPQWAIAPAGVIVPTLEIGVAAVLVLQTPQSLRVALGSAAVVLATFTAWMAWVRAQGLQVRCGCFGTGSAEIGPGSIWRNLELLGVALGGLILARQTSSPLPGPSIGMAIVVTASGLCVALLLALWMALPALVLNLDQFYRRSSGMPREG